MPPYSQEGRLSGAHWITRFHGSESYETLDTDFHKKVLKFVAALADAKVIPDDQNLAELDLKKVDLKTLAAQPIIPKVKSTFRSRMWAYLMHWSWLIYHMKLETEFNYEINQQLGSGISDFLKYCAVPSGSSSLRAESASDTLTAATSADGPTRALVDDFLDRQARLIDLIPPFKPGSGDTQIDIQWLHRDANGVPDVEASMGGAYAMMNAGGVDSELHHPPALESNHTKGKAIDWVFEWRANRLLIKNQSGDFVLIKSAPHNHINDEMIAVAKTYGVIHLLNKLDDLNHFSFDGK